LAGACAARIIFCNKPHKLIGKHFIASNYSIVGFQLVVELILILISEGAQVAPGTLQTFADGDQAAPQSNAFKLIVIYCNSKISLHFRKDCEIFCEGKKVNGVVKQNLPLSLMATQAAAARTHGVAIKLASATKITNAAIWYYCAALLSIVLLSLIRRESGLWCDWRVFSSLAGLDSVSKNALQNAKQLFHVSLPQMAKYCIMRECENILCGYLYDGDLYLSSEGNLWF
jgi:hypothetical protein